MKVAAVHSGSGCPIYPGINGRPFSSGLSVATDIPEPNPIYPLSLAGCHGFTLLHDAPFHGIL
jgi:hypothetical protein